MCEKTISLYNIKMKIKIIVLAVVAVLVVWGLSGYNSFVTLSEKADAGWSVVETQYQRRLDLIPNLVSSVRGIMTQEQEIFGKIAEARTAYGSASTPNAKAEAASQMETSLSRLLVVMENYPQLNSSQNVRDLMTQLEGTENRISVERIRFNEIVRDYNIKIKRFPSSLLASLTGFSERSYFEAVQGAESAPKVDLE